MIMWDDFDLEHHDFFFDKDNFPKNSYRDSLSYGIQIRLHIIYEETYIDSIP